MLLRGAAGLNTRDPASPAAARWRTPACSCFLRDPNPLCARASSFHGAAPAAPCSLPSPPGAAGAALPPTGSSPPRGERGPGPERGRTAAPSSERGQSSGRDPEQGQSRGGSSSPGPAAHPPRRWGRSRPRRSSPFPRRGRGSPRRRAARRARRRAAEVHLLQPFPALCAGGAEHPPRSIPRRRASHPPSAGERAGVGAGLRGGCAAPSPPSLRGAARGCARRRAPSPQSPGRAERGRCGRGGRAGMCGICGICGPGSAGCTGRDMREVRDVSHNAPSYLRRSACPQPPHSAGEKNSANPPCASPAPHPQHGGRGRAPGPRALQAPPRQRKPSRGGGGAGERGALRMLMMEGRPRRGLRSAPGAPVARQYGVPGG